MKILNEEEEYMNIQVRVVAAQQRRMHSHHLQEMRVEKDLIADMSQERKGEEGNWLHGPLPRKKNVSIKVEEERGKVGNYYMTPLVVIILSSISITVTHLTQ